MLLLCALVVGSGSVWASVKTVTYAWNSTDKAFKQEGATGDDVDAVTPSTTYTGSSQASAGPTGDKKTAVQLMKDNSGTIRGTASLTLNSFPYAIKNISFQYYTSSAKSGSMTATLNGKDFASITSDINSDKEWADQSLNILNGSFSSGGENLVISAEYRVNSVYIHSFTITYDTEKVFIKPGHDKTTYVTSKKLNFVGVTGLKAYVATKAAASGVTMTELEAAVPENTPLLLIGTANTQYEVPIAASATAPATNKLVAGDGSTDMSGVSGYNYILYSDGLFYQVTSGKIATYKAYLHLDSAPSAHALDIIFDESGEATGITEVANGQQTKCNGQYFNLAGQRVNTNLKGIVIVNGKKYFNK